MFLKPVAPSAIVVVGGVSFYITPCWTLYVVAGIAWPALAGVKFEVNLNFVLKMWK